MSRRKQREPRIPLAVQGGIRAQGLPGRSRRPWWSSRWLDMLEQFRLGARLGRGRSYATGGQVLNLAVESGEMSASVQGAGAEPYRCRIAMADPLSAQTAAHIAAEIRANPILFARLFVKDLPFSVERFFVDAHAPLFPRGIADLTTQCSCPDWGNPCKHLVAVLILFAEAIAADPCLLLTFRGFPASLLEPEPEPAPPPKEREQLPPSAAHADFWGNAALEPFDDSAVFFGLPDSGAGMIRRLGTPPFWRGADRFGETMEGIYSRVRMRTAAISADDPVDFRPPENRPVPQGANLKLKRYRLGIDISL